MAKKATFLPPAQDLRRKAVNFKRGFSLQLEPEVVKKLEAVVEKATDSFTVEVAEKLKQLRAAVMNLESEEAAIFALREIRNVSLEIKGMGGMFKYPLLTAFAKSLNDFAVAIGAPTEIQRDIIAAQIDALYVVMANRIQGGGGRIEKELLDALTIATQRHRNG